MRIGITHDWLDSSGGAERVLEVLAARLPDAEIWTLWATEEYRAQFRGRLRTTWMDRSPWRDNKALSLPLMPLAWAGAGGQYDSVVRLSHCFSHASGLEAKDPRDEFVYVHTPARYLWDQSIDTRGMGFAARLGAPPLRRLDRRIAARHHNIAANSNEIRRRIQDHWGRDATVIFPPVQTNYFTPGEPQSAAPFDRFVLGVSRWVPYKRDGAHRNSPELLIGIPQVAWSG